jgi:hypothetical protein
MNDGVTQRNPAALDLNRAAWVWHSWRLPSTCAPALRIAEMICAIFSASANRARICAGFHYRFSTRVGQEIGRQIGEHVITNYLQPVGAVARRAASSKNGPIFCALAR